MTQVAAKIVVGSTVANAADANKDMVCSVTAVDGDLACATAIAATPIGFVTAVVDGVVQSIGNGVKTKSCYISGDGGTTARAFGAIVAGDFVYWNPTIAGFNLAATDRFTLLYDSQAS